MAKYGKYTEYQDSGVEWLRKIPSHWGVIQLKRLGKFATGMTPSTAIQSYYAEEETEYGWIRPEDIFENSEKVEASKFLTKLGWETQRPIPDQSTVVCCIGTIGKLGFLSKKSVTNQQITALIPTNIDYAKYYYYLLCASRNQLEQLSTGNVVKILNSERLGSLWVPLLSNKEEASKIANFLDYETAQIDSLIAKQEKLIELLKEKRQAVISHAVTKGLNPDVAMKDSGVEWLGQVPEHWSVSLAKYQCKEITDGAHISPELENGEHYFVSIRDIKEGVINFEDALLTSDKSYQYLVHTGCKPFAGDILFSKDGTIGQTAITPFNTDFVVASSLIIIRPKYSKVTSEFLDLLLRSDVVQEQVESFVKGAALRRLSIQNLLKIWGVFPPLDEQKKIVDFVQFQLDKYKVLELKAEKQVELLKERRTALISSAVTGKINVTNWQHPNEAKTELSS